ncbi:MAG: DUF4203 domain-containing protein [Acidobacteriota bacterium]|nr:DUF4203 domain-containing protein [Acidobacteriota bacterium]
MSGLSELASDLGATLGGPLAIAAGLVLLLFGRRLYWLLAAAVGFVVVVTLSRRLLPELDEGTLLWASLLCGVAGAFVAVLAQRLLLGVVGGLAGAVIALWQVQQLGMERGLAWLVAAVVGGLVGGWLLSRLFEVALAVLSSLLGAQLVIDHVPVAPRWQLAAYLGLAGVGILFQLLRSRRRKKHERRRSS